MFKDSHNYSKPHLSSGSLTLLEEFDLLHPCFRRARHDPYASDDGMIRCHGPRLLSRYFPWSLEHSKVT
jgi:hypothetical protein